MSRLYKKNLIKSCAHITGGGIIENLPRILDKKFQAQIDLNKWDLGNIYKWLISLGVNQKELLKTFNAGYGMTLISDKKNTKLTEDVINKHNFSSTLLGKIDIKKNINEKSVLLVGKLSQ